MRPSGFVLTGFPGTGKLTVAPALAAALEDRGETVRLVDNHSINNTVFRLIEDDGITPLPREVWNKVGDVWQITLSTLEELTPPDWHIIFTAYLDGETDTGFLPRLETVAQQRDAVFIPVRLLCDPDENAPRIVSPERKGLMKSIDPEEPHRLAAKGGPYDPEHPNQVSIDVTNTPPVSAVAMVLEHAVSLESQNP